jgi:hypothetical protein
MRQFTDQHGTQWDVFEVSTGTLSIGRADYLPPAFRTGWLVFDNGQERRRLAPFPSEWSRFSEAALCALLASAELVRRTPRVRRTDDSSLRPTATNETLADQAPRA